jgi:hypothetical protein
MLTTISLYLMALQSAVTAMSIGTTSLDAANAVQKISSSLRQARSFQIVDTTANDAVDSTNTVVAVTRLHVVFPAAATNITVVSTSGGGTLTLSGTSAIFDRTTNGATLDFYRSDSQGNPAPSNGGYLWMQGTDNGAAVNRALVRTIAPEADAVQFIQPYAADGTTLSPNAVEISIVTSNNNGIAGTVSSHSTKGTTTLLTADMVYLRDHDPAGVTSAGAHGRTHIAN